MEYELRKKNDNSHCNQISALPSMNSSFTSKTRDHGEKAMIAANHLKNLAGDTRNMNESKINLDS